MYDWANSAYATTIAGAVLPAFFADEIVPEAVSMSKRLVPAEIAGSSTGSRLK